MKAIINQDKYIPTPSVLWVLITWVICSWSRVNSFLYPCNF
ncbi:hypothetical protein [Spirosoma harenae]